MRRSEPMKLLILTVLFLCIPQVNAGDQLGHRGGCEHKIYHDLTDNSLRCLEAGLRGVNGKPPLQDEKKLKSYLKVDTLPEIFEYLEFDVRETKGNGLIIYHGGKGGGRVFKGNNKALTYDERNRAIYATFETKKKWNKVKVKDLYENEINLLYLDGAYNQHPPKLAAYFEKIMEYKLDQQLMIEIKKVSCDNSRGNENPAKKLAEVVSNYMRTQKLENGKDELKFKNQKVGFLLYDADIGRLGGRKNLNCWCKNLKKMNLRVYKTGSHAPVNEVMDACN